MNRAEAEALAVAKRLAEQSAHVAMGAAIPGMDIREAAKALKPLVDEFDRAIRDMERKPE